MDSIQCTFTHIYEGNPSHDFRKICKTISLAGAFIHQRGGFPELLDEHRTKTGGNMSLRCSENSNAFVITAAGSHKGRLDGSDFVLVLETDFRNKKISYQSLSEKKPSSDTLFHASVFKEFPFIGGIIHTHQDPPGVRALLQLDYPPIDCDQWIGKLLNYFSEDIRAIRLKNHIENTRDAALFLEKRLEKHLTNTAGKREYRDLNRKFLREWHI